jgi:competence protein ComEC
VYAYRNIFMQDRVSAELHLERLRFRRAPLAAAALWFALGILLARLHSHQTVHLVASLLLSAILAVIALRNSLRLAVLPVAVVWITLGIAASDWQPAPTSQSALLGYADNLSRTVRGRVTRIHIPPPQPETTDADTTPAWEAAEDTTEQRGQPVSLDLAVDQIEQVTPDLSTMVPVSGGIRVSVYQAGPALNLHCGDRIELPLRIKPPDRFRTPGAFQYADYLLAQGIAAHSNVSASSIALLGQSQPTLRCRLYAAQTWASTRLISYSQSAANKCLPALLRLTPQDAEMLNAMLFGDRTGLNHTLRTGFERTGTFHLFVVSGLHIALVAAGLYWLLHKVLAPVWLATILTLAGTAAYAALTGFGQPAQRALTMTAVFLIARLLSRDRDSLNALGAAILAMLVLAPSSLFDASFQMTVLVIIAIAGIAIPLARRTPIHSAALTHLVFLRPRRVFAPRSAQLILMLEIWGEALASIASGAAGSTLFHRVDPGVTLLIPHLPSRRWSRYAPAFALRILLRTLELALISLVAELVMVLPMAVYFHRLPVFAVPANILILPIIGILVPAALVAFAAALISTKLAVLPAAITAGLLHAITFAINRLSGLHSADLRIPAPVWQLALAAGAAWIACCWLVRRSRFTALAATLALPIIAGCILLPESPVTTPASLEITALDVGQGDSILVINPEGSTMLIDAGGPIGSHGAAETVSSFDIGEEVVAPYLWTRRLRRLDILVLTHAHTDHMGGMPAILEDFRPRELWVGIDPASRLYRALLADAARLNIPVRHLHAGDSKTWGAVDINVLAPAIGYTNLAAPKNDDSIVLHLQFGQASVLLEGDAERPTEDAMLAADLIHPVTLLKVGHHGSKTSSNPEFLAAAHPHEAVISVGRNNPFGHPRAEVIQRFAEEHTRLYRTDLFGLTSFLLSSDGALHDVAEQVLESDARVP